MIYVEVHEPFGLEVDPADLERAAFLALHSQTDPAKCELTIVLAGDEQLRRLNREYLGMDAPTDVLAFPSGHKDPESGGEYLGDVLISFPRALQQAAADGHPVRDELQLLVVHGVLHLLGHDHAEAAEKNRMWAAQGEILGQLGLSAINPPAE